MYMNPWTVYNLKNDATSLRIWRKILHAWLHDIGHCNFAQSFFSNSPGWSPRPMAQLHLGWGMPMGSVIAFYFHGLWLRGRRKKKHSNNRNLFPMDFSQASRGKLTFNRPFRSRLTVTYSLLWPQPGSWRNGWENTQWTCFRDICKSCDINVWLLYYIASKLYSKKHVWRHTLYISIYIYICIFLIFSTIIGLMQFSTGNMEQPMNLWTY